MDPLAFLSSNIWTRINRAMDAEGKQTVPNALRLCRSTACLALLLSLALPAAAKAGDAPIIAFDIPAEPLGKALRAFADQTHQQLLFADVAVAGRTAPAIKGAFTPEAVLKRLLAGSGLEVDRTSPSTLVVKPAAAIARRTAMSSLPTAPLQTPAMDADPVPPSPTSKPADNSSEPGPPPSEVLVTGTHIRGVKSGASPLQVVTKEDMYLHGDATVADALNRLPEMFNGVSNPVTALAGTDRLGTNETFSTGVNLRGLGANATLVLIDGRRMAGSGQLGDFADVSAIPSAAVERVEVLLDGASAIYGSDAVGGVVNIITRKSYEGADSTLRFGADDGTVGAYVQATQVLGFKWTGGRALVSYEYQHNDRVAASTRRFTADSDLTALGGTNHEVFYASPGNILGLNAAGNGYVPVYAIPAGNGTGLTSSSFIPGAVNYSDTFRLADISPETSRNAIYADVSQEFGSHTTVDLEGRYNLRSNRAHETPSYTIFQVTKADPYYVAPPNGAASELIAYSPENLFGTTREQADNQNFELSAGVKQDLIGDWKLNAYAGVTGESARDFITNLLNSGNLNEALGNTPDNPATPYSTAANGFFNPYGTGANASQPLKTFLSSGWDRVFNTSQVSTVNVQADGSLFELPGGVVRGAFGAQYRHERFNYTIYGETSGTTASFTGATPSSRNVEAIFGELNVPFVGAANALPGLEKLELSIAGRVERYDNVGTTANPKLGLVWKPIDDLAVKATYGTSFRAPSLPEIASPTLVAPTSVSANGASTLVLLQYGGNPNLKPETATTWTAGVDWTPSRFPGLHVGVNWFDIEFDNEISNPGERYLANILSTPAYASLVRRLNPSNAADQAAVKALLALSTSGLANLFPTTAYGAIIDARYLNTASMHVSGIDLNVDYGWRWKDDRFSFNANGSYLTTFNQVQVSGAPALSVLDTPNNPVNFKGRAILDWSHGPYQAAFTLNYVNAYKDPVAHRRIDSWTTADIALTWRAPSLSGPWKGASVGVVVTNLLNSDPPFYDSSQGIGYDPANADPFGRAISVQLSKHW